MCTAINLKTDAHYFGRNLDLDCSYGEEICILPRSCPINYRLTDNSPRHYAMIGMATVVGGVPLFYDAVNEYGVAMAGLSFPENAYYGEPCDKKTSICQFEFIPKILGECKNLDEVRAMLDEIAIVNIPFSDALPVSPLHWIISYREHSLVVETMLDGMHIHENPTGILTNNPPFEYQMFNLNNYRGLKVENGESSFSCRLKLKEYCQGLGGLGLPGDVSSMSRFVRAVFLKESSVSECDEKSSVSQFFHLLGGVEMCRGICRAPSGKYDITVYSSCVNCDTGAYYYTTYGKRQISCVEMRRENLDSEAVIRYPLALEEQIYRHN